MLLKEKDNIMRLLNENEKDIIMQVLKNFGFALSGGSREERQNGRIVYHLSIEMGTAATLGQDLGPKLKRVLRADELYNLGHRLA